MNVNVNLELLQSWFRKLYNISLNSRIYKTSIKVNEVYTKANWKVLIALQKAEHVVLPTDCRDHVFRIVI